MIKPSSSEGLKDGESLNLQQRDLGSIEIFPQTLNHSPNGRYAAVCGDGEYIVYTALAWRSKSYGSALDLFGIVMIHLLLVHLPFVKVGLVLKFSKFPRIFNP